MRGLAPDTNPLSAKVHQLTTLNRSSTDSPETTVFKNSHAFCLQLVSCQLAALIGTAFNDVLLDGNDKHTSDHAQARPRLSRLGLLIASAIDGLFTNP